MKMLPNEDRPSFKNGESSLCLLVLALLSSKSLPLRQPLTKRVQHMAHNGISLGKSNPEFHRGNKHHYSPAPEAQGLLDTCPHSSGQRRVQSPWLGNLFEE